MNVTTTVAETENSHGFPQRSAASGSQQPLANVVTPCLSPDMWSRTGKLVRSNESIASVEESVSRGKRDGDLNRVCVSERQKKLKAVSSVRGENAAQRRLSEAEPDVEIKNWEQRDCDVALYETNRELESQRLELWQANGWTDQAQREKKNVCGELDMRNRLFQESRARHRQEIEELRRICCEDTDRARQLRIVELLMPQERNPTSVSQLLTQGFTEQGEFLENFTVLRQRAGLARPTFPVNP